MCESGYGTQLEPAALLERDCRALVRNYRLRRVYDGLQHAFQIESRGDLMADGDQRLQNFNFAFGHQQAGIMQRRRSSFGDT